MMGSNRNFLFKGSTFRGYVSFRDGTCLSHLSHYSSLDSRVIFLTAIIDWSASGVKQMATVDSCASPPLTMLRPSWYCWIPLFSWWSHFTEKLTKKNGKNGVMDGDAGVSLLCDLYLLHPFWRQQTMEIAQCPWICRSIHDPWVVLGCTSLNGWGMMRNGKNHVSISEMTLHTLFPLSTVP